MGASATLSPSYLQAHRQEGRACPAGMSDRDGQGEVWPLLSVEVRKGVSGAQVMAWVSLSISVSWE